MNDKLSYWIAGIGTALAIGTTFYQVYIKPIRRFRRQSGLSLKDLDVAKAMTLDRVINVLDVSGAGDKKEEELQRILEGMPIKVQENIRPWMECYQPRDTVARTIYKQPEVRRYLSEKGD